MVGTGDIFTSVFRAEKMLYLRSLILKQEIKIIHRISVAFIIYSIVDIYVLKDTPALIIASFGNAFSRCGNACQNIKFHTEKAAVYFLAHLFSEEHGYPFFFGVFKTKNRIFNTAPVKKRSHRIIKDSRESSVIIRRLYSFNFTLTFFTEKLRVSVGKKDSAGKTFFRK